MQSEIEALFNFTSNNAVFFFFPHSLWKEFASQNCPFPHIACLVALSSSGFVE